MTEQPAILALNTWAGRREHPVLVIGETKKKYRIKALSRLQLGGRNRWIEKDEVALVPKWAVRIEKKEAGR